MICTAYWRRPAPWYHSSKSKPRGSDIDRLFSANMTELRDTCDLIAFLSSLLPQRQNDVDEKA